MKESDKHKIVNFYSPNNLSLLLSLHVVLTAVKQPQSDHSRAISCGGGVMGGIRVVVVDSSTPPVNQTKSYEKERQMMQMFVGASTNGDDTLINIF